MKLYPGVSGTVIVRNVPEFQSEKKLKAGEFKAELSNYQWNAVSVRLLVTPLHQGLLGLYRFARIILTDTAYLTGQNTNKSWGKQDKSWRIQVKNYRSLYSREQESCSLEQISESDPDRDTLRVSPAALRSYRETCQPARKTLFDSPA